MSYCKVIPAVTRVKPARLFGVRLRSTAAASTQRKELKTEDAPLDPSCTVVEKPCDVDLISGKAHAQRRWISVDFDNTQEAYKSKDTLELLRSLLVFKLCTSDFLVDKNKQASYLWFVKK